MQEILHGHKARKRFGQNFLKDDYWIEKIAASIQPEPGQNIIEIGRDRPHLPGSLLPGPVIFPAWKSTKIWQHGCEPNFLLNN